VSFPTTSHVTSVAPAQQLAGILNGHHNGEGHAAHGTVSPSTMGGSATDPVKDFSGSLPHHNAADQSSGFAPLGPDTREFSGEIPSAALQDVKLRISADLSKQVGLPATGHK